MGRKRKAPNSQLPPRWQYKNGAFYYLPRAEERAEFDGKSWFRLGTRLPEALRAYANRKEIATGETVASVADKYVTEKVATYKPNTQRNYLRAVKRLRAVLGHNKVALITPQSTYQYLERVRSEYGMNEANNDLKVLNLILDCAVRWGVINRHPIKGHVKYFGKRDGLRKERNRYVEDWELEEWTKVAPLKLRAFAALVMLTGARKNEILRLEHGGVTEKYLVVPGKKTESIPEQVYTMTPALSKAIEMAIQSQVVPSRFLLANKNGDCFYNSEDKSPTFDRSWRRSMVQAIKQTKLEESFTMHDLRAKVGSDAETETRAQELLGHTTPDMTRRHYRRKKRTILPTS
ncbi:tyrosine recombinase XerC [Marinobacter sp. W-8]|uniref:tyrosine recombinase XerC n=1 Tax=Marinobacter sp. W-8 TaxID=3369658 RepID=UPI0037CAA479